jgi:hypothetical protein
MRAREKKIRPARENKNNVCIPKMGRGGICLFPEMKTATVVQSFTQKESGERSLISLVAFHSSQPTDITSQSNPFLQSLGMDFLEQSHLCPNVPLIQKLDHAALTLKPHFYAGFGLRQCNKSGQ